MSSYNPTIWISHFSHSTRDESGSQTPSEPRSARTRARRMDGGVEASPQPTTLTEIVAEPSTVGSTVLRIPVTLRPGLRVHAGRIWAESQDGQRMPTMLRVIDSYPESGQPRRALLILPWRFTETAARRIRIVADDGPDLPAEKLHGFAQSPGENTVTVEGSEIHVKSRGEDRYHVRPILPARRETIRRIEVIEENEHYYWVRILEPDPDWPRIIEVRADSSGAVAVKVHLQRLLRGVRDDGFCPNLGIEIKSKADLVEASQGSMQTLHSFQEGEKAPLRWGAIDVQFPDAAAKQVGDLVVESPTDDASAEPGETTLNYFRSRVISHVPHQATAFRSAGVLLKPHDSICWRSTWLPEVEVRSQLGRRQNDSTEGTTISPTAADHSALVLDMQMKGDDFGNFCHLGYPNSIMNRLNNAAFLFDTSDDLGGRPLLNAALLWCGNFHNNTVYWGEEGNEFGGTRYPEIDGLYRVARRSGVYPWRSNSGIDYCTKGFEAFLRAYHETGDPAMLCAFRHQVEFARRNVHADTGQTRNIGIVRDFVHCYRLSGSESFLDDAERLTSELDSVTGADGLFSQSGEPIEVDPPFIDDDETGYQHPFAKPYILNYALIGLPALLEERESPRARRIVRSVADYMTSTQDPLGCWRYPHPASSTLNVASTMEQCWGLVQACRVLGDDDAWLDAIERGLRLRIIPWRSRRSLIHLITAWEYDAGKAATVSDMYKYYARPGLRDGSRDYTEGKISYGASIEGIVTYADVLGYYLSRRPVDALVAAPQEESPLARVISRLEHEKTGRQ